MNRWQFYTAASMAVVCVVLSTALVGFSYKNQQVQKELQARQAQINNSVLGPQAQQIAGNVIQEMATIARTNSAMRALLTKHGYTLQQEAPATDGTGTEDITPSEDL